MSALHQCFCMVPVAHLPAITDMNAIHSRRMLCIGIEAIEEVPMNYEDLTPEQQEKAKAGKSIDELIELAKTEGVELSD